MKKRIQTAEITIASVVLLSIIGSFFGIPSPFVGCASVLRAKPPTEAELNMAKIGDPPSAEHAEKAIREYLGRALKDPESLRLRMGTMRKAYYNRTMGCPNKFAWRVDAGVNAKNSYGGYTGEQPYHFYFVFDKLVAVGTQESRYSSYGKYSIYVISEFGSGGLTAEQAMITSSEKKESSTDVPEEDFDP